MATTYDLFYDHATIFDVEMINDLPTRKHGSNWLIDFSALSKSESEGGRFDCRGVYVFCISTKSLKPMYVGRTIAGTFRTRLIKGHPAEQVAGYHGTPVLFLLYPKGMKKGRKDAIKELERHLIADAHHVNRDVMNDKQTLKFQYRVTGLFPRMPGRHNVRSKFAKAVGW